MELFSLIINETNHILWTYILIAMLLGCAIWFSIKTKFVQFRMLGEMIRLLGDSTAKINGHEKHISSFQAFTISLASRVGTGNLAGVATPAPVRGPPPRRHSRRSGSNLLDVDYRLIGLQQCFRRILSCPTL